MTDGLELDEGLSVGIGTRTGDSAEDTLGVGELVIVLMGETEIVGVTLGDGFMLTVGDAEFAPETTGVGAV